MPLDAVTPSTAPVTPAYVPVDTSEIADAGAREDAVMANVLAEKKAAWREEADADDTDTNTEVQEAVADANDDTPDEEPVKAKAAPAPVAPAAPTAEDTARKASLANAARLERESVRRSTELASKAAELKAQEAKLAEGNAKIAAFEKAYNDPDALLELLAERVTPEKMSRFFIEANDPSKVAERRAKAAQEPVTSELTKLREEMAALKAERAEEAAKAQSQAKRQENEKQFSARVLDLKADAPLAARLLSKRPQDFFAMADAAATQLMAKNPDANWDDVIHDVNKQLSDFTGALAEEAAAASSTPEKTGKVSAAAKAPTVSNRAASERSAILDEDERWESLPFDERVKRAEKRERLRG